MSVYKGDFLGFSLGGQHTYGLNITRVSTNDRYTEALVPNFNDISTQVPGGDGSYYWGSDYTQRQFVVDFAFDALTDEDIKNLKIMLGSRELRPLIFDEHKDRYYMVKCMQAPTISYIAFRPERGENDEEVPQDDEEGVGPKIYKGEGSIQFIAYYPFAMGTESISIGTGLGLTVENVGELPAYPMVIYTASSAASGRSISGANGQLIFSNFTPKSGDAYIRVNCRTQLIEGLNSSSQRTGNIYNQYITAGDFFTIPVGESTFSCVGGSAEYTPLYY